MLLQRSKLVIVTLVFFHCGNESVAEGGAERISLELVLIHNMVPFLIHPSLPKQACP